MFSLTPRLVLASVSEGLISCNMALFAKKMLSLDAAVKSLKTTETKAAREVVDFVNKGGIGYALLVGTKKMEQVAAKRGTLLLS
jgi:hypothetical protein